ncbi:MAG: hypothetical protein ACK5HO_01515, partial [Pseudomonadota bacterium]
MVTRLFQRQGDRVGVLEVLFRRLVSLKRKGVARPKEPLRCFYLRQPSIYLALLFALLLAQVSFAQTRLLGRSADGDLIGYAVYQKGGAVRVESIGNLEPSQNVGHLYGKYLSSADKTLIKVR